MAVFADHLVLARWAFAQLGIERFEQLSKLLHAPEFEGWAEDGGTYFVRQLVNGLPKTRPTSSDMLRDYDANIVRHWRHITRVRNTQGPTLHPLYFQYCGLLFTEIYLASYFGDRQALLRSLNEILEKGVGHDWTIASSVVRRRGRKKAALPEIQPFTEDDLNKVAFWMATGSGKTLLMHCHIRQYLHYARKADVLKDLNRIILLTPNESLSRQHQEEFELSGIEAALFDKDAAMRLEFQGRGVDIIDVHKLRETSGDKTVAVDTFEGNNLVFVDEGHRGSGGEEWMEKRARLCANGFSFEYSATFGQAIKAASGSKQKDLIQTYSKSILFDYSYKFFYDDGYGKDFNILNLAEEHEEETQPLYLTACMLGFYQQCRRFAQGGAALAPYLLESPLMIFVGGSVTGVRQNQEDTDLVLILRFLAEFVDNRAETERRLEKLLRRQARLVAGGEDVFAKFFPFVETLWRPDQAGEVFTDILRYVFNAPGGGKLHILRLQGSDGEIGLRVGDYPWFGVVNVGDAKKLCDLCKTGEGDTYVVDDLPFSESLFEGIRQPGSQIRLLAGAKKFTEGWSSWRVSAMGLMNVGKKEGTEIIQLFGRGVRLKGFRFKLKRTSALDALDYQAEGYPQAHPDYIELLETLNVFGIRSDYMKEFQEYLENEGVGEQERRELILLPTIQLPEFKEGKIQLNVIRPRKDMPDFKRSVRFRLSSLEGQLSSRVMADWYPRLQKHSSAGVSAGPAAQLNRDILRRDHLAFLRWDRIWFDLERHKRENAYYNVVLSSAVLLELMTQSWWYELLIPPGYLDFRFDRLALFQDIATHLLKGYLDRFYLFQKREFEKPFLEYQVLEPSDDDLIRKSYQLLVKKSAGPLIERLRKLAEKFAAGEFEAYSFDNLQIFQAERHLYQPLIHLTHNKGEDSLVKVIPTHLNDGEKRFVDDLAKVCRTEAHGLLHDVDLYLLRNHSSDKAIAFFSERAFRPDFILWLLKGDKQTIAFLDPKGFHHFTDNFNNPKVQMAREIKNLERDLSMRANIRLESYLISQTYRDSLRWPSQKETGRDATLDEYRGHHILMAKDEPEDYVAQLVADLAN
ncbi:MAG: DEAD/DEAH box helicase family protein [Acidobacteriia bacterium]|nr:DEAD/DEAH box helicase family protein [Terriglobia bacterium]